MKVIHLILSKNVVYWVDFLDVLKLGNLISQRHVLEIHLASFGISFQCAMVYYVVVAILMKWKCPIWMHGIVHDDHSLDAYISTLDCLWMRIRTYVD